MITTEQYYYIQDGTHPAEWEIHRIRNSHSIHKIQIVSEIYKLIPISHKVTVQSRKVNIRGRGRSYEFLSKSVNVKIEASFKFMKLEM